MDSQRDQQQQLDNRTAARVDLPAMNNSEQSNAVEDDIDAWNPMEDDYTNKAFNDYKEPSTAELRKWMIQKGEKAPTEDLMATYRSPDGDVRLFINGIPPDLTQEGIRGLFNQAGKVSYCKVIPKRDTSRKDTFGFVGYQSYREAEKAIRLFDGFCLGENMRLKVNLAKRKAPDMPYADSALPAGLNEVNGVDEGLDWDTSITDSAGTECAVTNEESAEVAKDELTTNGVAKDKMTTNEVAKDEKPSEYQKNQTPEQNHYDNHTHTKAAETNRNTSDNSTPVTQSAAVPSSTGSQVNGQKVSTKQQIPEAPCSVCGKNGRRRCSSCKIQYCSKGCQITDWPEHKKVCTWKSQKEMEVIKPPKKDKPFVIDEDEMEISDPLGFMSHFGVNVRPDIMHAIAPNAFEQDRSSYLEYLDSEYPQINGVRQPLERAQITEIEEPAENTAIVENQRSPLIEEIDAPDNNTRQPNNTPLINEIGSEQQAQQPLITEVSSTSEAFMHPVSQKNSKPLIEEIMTLNSTSNLESKLDFITEKPNDESSATNITEISCTATTEGRAPLITEITPGESVSQAPQNAQTTNQHHKEEEPNNVMPNQIYHRYRVADIPREDLHPDNLYDIVATSVSSPSLFWAQIFARDALERQTFLYQTLNEVYANSVYENYVPMPGDVCVAQYTLDDNWYRCKVNFINNNGYINVTHIDFGSSEDVDVTRIRRISSDLAAVKIQAIKCSLYFVDGSPREWSLEMIEAFRSAVLDVKCRVKCVEVKDSVCFVEVYSDKVNDMLQEMKNKSELNPAALPEQPMDTLPQRSEPIHQVMSVSSDTITTPTMSRDERIPTTIADHSSQPMSTQPMTTPSVSHDQRIPTTIADQSSQPMSTEPMTTATMSHEQPLATNNPIIPEQSSQSISPNTITTPSALPGQSQPMSDMNTSDQPSQLPSIESVSTPMELPKQDPNIPETTLPATESEVTHPEVNDSTPHIALSGQVPHIPGPPSSPLPDINQQGQPSTSSDKLSNSLSSSSSEVDLKLPLSPSRHSNFVPRQKFEAVVSSVVSPIEFQAVLSDPELLSKLDELHAKLQEHCNATPYDPSIMYKYNDVCAVRSSKDKEWHRATVVFSYKNSFSVQFLDIDAKERVPVEYMRPVPSWAEALPPRCIMCCLGGIVKRPGMTNFGKDASEKFKSLVLNKKFTCQDISRKKNCYMIDLLDESGRPSVARELIDGGFADPFVKILKERNMPIKEENMETVNPSFLSCRMAISSAKLPPPGQLFEANVTQFESPSNFFIHLRDEESQGKLDGICQDMNRYYSSLPPPTDWQAREGQHCAAFFRSSWLRAFVKSINEDKVATVFCVDFGNVEIVPNSALRPLEPQFSSLPHCALHCSLAYISPPEGSTEWSKDAIEFARMKMPLSSTVNVSLVFKGQTILFIDVFLQNSDSLSRLLMSKSLATDRKHQSSPNKEERFVKPYETKGQSPQKSPRQRNRDKQLTPREIAISTAKLPPFKGLFKGFVTHITSPGCFSIQIADFELASKVAALHNDMNSHYNSSTYSAYQPTFNGVCAAQFTGDNSWYRAWIEKIVDVHVHVYYVDYGNSEVLDVSRLRPLEAKFKALPYAAITCSLGSITTAQGEWSQEAKEFFSSKVPLFEALEVKFVFKKFDSIFLEILDPQDPTTSINKAMVANNLAVWMFDKKPTRREFSSSSPPGAMPVDVREKKSKVSENEVKSLENENKPEPIQNQERVVEKSGTETQESVVQRPLKFAVDSVPMVAVQHGVFHNCMVCDVKPTGIVSFQMLTKEIQEFASLGTNISNHCSQLDHSSYSPSVGELCFVCFTEDKEWYRGVVDDVLPNNKFKVTFVDYGNEDTVSPEAIRVMDAKFLSLPRQAFTGPLKGITSTNQKPLPVDVINALKQQLLEKRLFVRVDEDGVELFNVGPNDDPTESINKNYIEILYPQVPTEVDAQFPALVTEVHGTCEIWLQPQDQRDVIKTLMDDVNLYCNNTSPMTSSPSQGDLLFAKHSFYNSWYRVRVDQWKPPMASVCFVDYGYSEQVTLDKLRPPRSDLLRLPPQAVKCCLNRVVQGNPGADDFIKQILNREFVVKIVEKKGDCLGVELEDFGVPNGPLNINDYLIGFGYEA